MKIKHFTGKTICDITYDYGMHIVFTDGSVLDIASRYEGGLEVTSMIEETVTEKRNKYIELDRD